MSGTPNNALIDQHRNDLVQYLIGFGASLLEQYGEFYPVGAYIDLAGEIVPLAVYDGEEKPDSMDVIENLYSEFVSRTRSGHAIAWAVAWDARVTSEEHPDGTDAVVVRTYHSHAPDQILYFFPYIMVAGESQFADNWWTELWQPEG